MLTLMLKCSNQFMTESQREEIDGTALKSKNHYNINGRTNQLISIIHHSSKLPINNYQKSIILKALTFYVASVIQLLLIIFHQQEIFQRNLQLPDFYSVREFNKMISILMVPEEVMMKLWPEVPLLTPELLTSSLIKLVHKLNMFQLDKL